MRFLKGFGALLLLLAVLAGLPYALAVLGGNPFPAQLTWPAIQHALLTPDTGRVLVGLITIIAWVAWAVVALSVLAELVTILSKQRVRIQLPGLHATQRAAGTLLVLVIAMLAVTPQLQPIPAQAAPTPAPPAASHSQPQTRDQPGPSASPVPTTAARPNLDAAVESLAKPAPTVATGATRLVAAASPAAQPVTHVVGSGDLLWELAEKYYDHGPSWTRIANANQLQDPDHLRVGQKLVIPGARQQQQPSGDTVEVDRGDTLSSIAEEQLGDASDWPDLYRANRDQIADPDLIDVGQVLTIPGADKPDTAKQQRPDRRNQPDRPRADASPDPSDNDRASAPAPVPPARQAPAEERGSGRPTEPAAEPSATTDPGNGSSGATAPPGTEEQSNPGQASGSAPNDPSDDVYAAPAALAGVGLLLTAGLVSTLRRRRTRQLTRRRPGRRIPAAPRRALPVETAMRQQVEPLTVTALDSALRAIGAHCHAHDVAPPRLSGVRVSDRRLDLILTESAHSAPEGVSVADSGLVWTVDADHLPTLLAIPGGDSAGQPWPALVTLGRDADDAHLLVDLETAGSLSVLADTPEQATAAITGLALELAVSPWAMDIRLTLVGGQLCAGLPAALDNPLVRHVDNLDQLLEELEDRAEEQRPYLVASATRVGQKRVDPDLADAWSPEIVFVDGPLSEAQSARLTEIVTALPRVAIATVTTQSASDGKGGDDWQFQMVPDTGKARLTPHGWDFGPQLVPPSLYQNVLDLIVTTGRDDTLPAPWWNHLAAEAEADRPAATVTHLHAATTNRVDEDDTNQDDAGQNPEATDTNESLTVDDAAGFDVDDDQTGAREEPQPVRRLQALGGNLIDRLPAGDVTAPAGPPPADDEGLEAADAVVLPMHPTLRILGAVELLGAAGIRNRVPKRCMEYLGYLLEHPGSSAARIAAAFSVEHETVRTTISYLRKWLGSDADGTPYLPDAYTGGYVLDGRVTSDWARVQLLIGTGINSAPTVNLRQALELVRGRPFADAADQDWAWDTLRTDIQSVIADLAHELTTRSLDRNDLRTARWAAARGLLVDPAAELLLADRVRTEQQAGDTDEVDRLIARITNHARQQGTDLLDDTVDVLQQAVQGRRR